MDFHSKTAALIIPTTTPGSFGDAAMLSVAIKTLKETHSKVDLLLGKKWDLSDLNCTPDNCISAERFFYKNSFLQRIYLLSKLKNYSHVVYIGADTIDGKYNPLSVRNRIYLLNQAAKKGLKATLFGSSYNKNPEETTRLALTNLPADVKICARDPRSRDRMQEKLNRPITQTADLAFLLDPRPDTKEAKYAKIWLDKRKSYGDKIIGLNANYLQLKKCPTLEKSLTKLMQFLAENNISMLLVPHDIRPENRDEDLLNSASLATTKNLHDRFYMLPPRSPAIVKAVLSNVDMVVTGRMHAAILGLSTGTPPFCFAYQDKFEGLMSFFELENLDLLSTPEELCENPIEMGKKIILHLDKIDIYKKLIEKNLPKVINLSKENFA